MINLPMLKLTTLRANFYVILLIKVIIFSNAYVSKRQSQKKN